MSWTPTSAFLMSMAAGGIYAAADIGHSHGKNVPRILIGAAAFGFVCVGIDNATNGPAGTALAALFLFAAFMNKGAHATILIANLIQNIGAQKHG